VIDRWRKAIALSIRSGENMEATNVRVYCRSTTAFDAKNGELIRLLDHVANGIRAATELVASGSSQDAVSNHLFSLLADMEPLLPKETMDTTYPDALVLQVSLLVCCAYAAAQCILHTDCIDYFVY
jgi:hypothetical protein